MKKVFAYSAIVLLLAAAAASCNKNESAISGDGQIRLALTSPGTRALVENAADLQANQSIKVFDFLDGTNYFAADESVSYSDGAWNYDSGKGYTWKTGSHTFFGYTAGAGTLDADKKLTVSKTLTTAADDQVDILYSNIVTKTAEQAKADNYAAVPLNMDHLFAAVAIRIKNSTSSSVVVNSASAPAIPNQGSATVDFSQATPEVEYGTVGTDGDFVAGTALANLTVAKDGYADVLNQSADTTYMVVWPQEVAADALTVTVTYTTGTGDDAETFENKVVKLPAATWEAGNKYVYTLVIYPTDIRLVFKVQPWDVGEAGAIDTEDGSINMSNVTWMNTKLMVNGVLTNTVNNSGYSVTMYKNPYLPVAKTYTEIVYKTYEEDVYQTYEEDVIDEETGEVIHKAGDPVLDEDDEPIVIHAAGEQVLDEDDNPIVLHEVGDPVLDENGNQVYENGTQYSGYYPAQGYFTVNYPVAGLFKIELIPAYGETTVSPEYYEILIYDNSTNPAAFRAIDPDGEDITNNTVYFRVAAATEQDGAQHKAQINILFKPDGSDDWISAYSEIRANYACVIPAN